jgi:hypothetical protein
LNLTYFLDYDLFRFDLFRFDYSMFFDNVKLYIYIYIYSFVM